MTATISTIDTHTLTRQIARPCTKMQNVYIYTSRSHDSSVHLSTHIEHVNCCVPPMVNIYTYILSSGFRISLPVHGQCAPRLRSSRHLTQSVPPPVTCRTATPPPNERRARAESREDARGGSNRGSRGYIPFLRVLRNQTCGSLHGQSAPCCGARARRPPTRAALRPRLCLHR